MSLDFDFPVESLWKVWSDPKLFAKWRSLDAIDVTIVMYDFRPGGKWKYTMPMPNGYDYVGEGSFIEVVPLKKISTTAQFEFVDEVAELVFLFEDKGDKTRLAFSNTFQTEEYSKKQIEQMGFERRWADDFKRLLKVLQAIK